MAAMMPAQFWGCVVARALSGSQPLVMNTGSQSVFLAASSPGGRGEGALWGFF